MLPDELAFDLSLVVPAQGQICADEFLPYLPRERRDGRCFFEKLEGRGHFLVFGHAVASNEMQRGHLGVHPDDLFLSQFVGCREQRHGCHKFDGRCRTDRLSVETANLFLPGCQRFGERLLHGVAIHGFAGEIRGQVGQSFTGTANLSA